MARTASDRKTAISAPRGDNRKGQGSWGEKHGRRFRQIARSAGPEAEENLRELVLRAGRTYLGSGRRTWPCLRSRPRLCPGLICRRSAFDSITCVGHPAKGDVSCEPAGPTGHIALEAFVLLSQA